MPKKNLVSIITVCLNSESTIARTIESVLKQTYKNVEYIIIDGGSRDSTLEIVKRYQPEFAGRMRWISEADHGMYDALNKGIGMAKGDLVGIINSDDWYETEAIEIMLEEFQRAKECVLYGIMRIWDGSQEIQLVRIHHSHLGEENVSHPTCFVPRSFYASFGGFDLKYRSASDYELMLRFLSRGVKFVPVDKVIANFSLGGITTSERDLGIIESYRIRAAYGYLARERAQWEIFKIRLKAAVGKFGLHL